MTDELAVVQPVAEPMPMAGTFLVAQLRVCDARLEEAVPRLLGAADNDAVHDLRVALRRTRTLLEAGRSVLGRFRADEVRASLRDAQRFSGTLRDEEVLLEILTTLDAGQTRAVSAAVGDWIEARRRRERRLRGAMRRRIREGEIERGRRLLAALVAFRIKPSRDRRLSKFARRAVEDARRQVDHRRAGSLHETEALHGLRIAYKRLRYTVEAFASALPADFSALGQSAARFQSRLGRIHDVDMAIARVSAAPGLLEKARQALLANLDRVRRERVVAVEQDLALGSIEPPAERSIP